MTKQEKLLASLRNNPKAVRFDDACKLAECLGFTLRGRQRFASDFWQNGRAAFIEFSKSWWLHPAVSGKTMTR